MDKLSENQREIYNLLTNQGLSQKDVAHRLQKSKQSISKVVQKLIKKGYLKSYERGGLTTLTTVAKKVVDQSLWRYHAIQLMLSPYYFYQRYHKIREERGNYGIRHKQFTLILHRDKVRIQSNAGQGWKDKDKWQAIRKAEDDLNDFIFFAARRYGFAIVKDGRISMKMLSSELALEGSKFAETYGESTGQRFLSCRFDGRVYFVIDMSTGRYEHEYIGKETISNSESLEPYINDLCFNKPLTNSQLTSRLGDTTTVLEKTADLINKIVLHLKDKGDFEP